jgi:MYXO-CTERM domain-containing protein
VKRVIEKVEMGRILAAGLMLLILSANSVGAATIECTETSPCRLTDLIALPPGDGFLSGNLTLFFSDFDAIATGSLAPLDPEQIVVANTMSGLGFDLVGGLSANNGELGDLLIRFTVAVEVPDASLIRALLSFNGSASGRGAGASVTETFEGISDLQLFVYAIGEGPIFLNDDVDFEPGRYDVLRVTKDIIVDSTVLEGEPPGNAQISLITQEFIIPEPGTGLLALLGVAGAVLLRRRLS